MDGPQDLGGRMGFGPVRPEVDEPVFHAEWEKAALGLTLCCGALGHWNIDGGRYARESLAPAIYYTASYYEIWLRALENLLVAHGEVTAQELREGRMLQPGLRPERRLPADEVTRALRKGGPFGRESDAPARFAVGERVTTKLNRTPRHTRLPGYARGKSGVIEDVKGVFVYPDTAAHGEGEQPTWLYTVVFDGPTLWGPESDPALTVSIDAWEPYLERG